MTANRIRGKHFNSHLSVYIKVVNSMLAKEIKQYMQHFVFKNLFASVK